MSGPSFWQTLLGRRAIEKDLPQLVENLGRIAAALEVIAVRLPRPPAPTLPSPSPAQEKEPPR